MFTRSWRNLRNQSLNTELAANVSYNDKSIDKLVRRVRKSLETKPVDAKVDLSKGFIDEHGSKTGLRVKYNTLAKEVEKTLLDPGNTETVKIRTTVVQPKVSTAESGTNCWRSFSAPFPACGVSTSSTNIFKSTMTLRHSTWGSTTKGPSPSPACPAWSWPATG